MKSTLTLAAAVGLMLIAVTVSAQGTISDGAANFVRGASPWDSSPAADFTGVSATLTQDHVFEFGWAFRVSGDTQETFFPAPTSQSYVADTSTNSWTDVGGRGLFDAQELTTVADTLGPSGAVLSAMTITNLSTTNPLLIDVFVMADIDLAGAANDSAVIGSGNGHITITDPSGNTAEIRGQGADAHLVRPFGATDLGVVLSDAAVTNFDNTGLPFGPGDFTGGFQWFTVTIPASGSMTYTFALAVNDAAVPVELLRFTIE